MGGILGIFEGVFENWDNVSVGTTIAISSSDIHVRRRPGDKIKAGNGYVCFERVEQHFG
jgi:hypothetical protein